MHSERGVDDTGIEPEDRKIWLAVLAVVVVAALLIFK